MAIWSCLGRRIIHRLFFSTLSILMLTNVLILGQDFEGPIQIDDGVDSKVLVLGVDPNGTQGFDPAYDLYAPPPPPSGAFDARFSILGEDYITDIRDNTINEKQFHMSYQVSAGNGPIVLHWDSTHLDSLGTFLIVDDITGNLFGPIDMTTIDSLEVIDPVIMNKLRILITPFARISAPSNLTAQVFNLPWRVQLNWVDNSNNEMGFVIERDKNGSGFVVLDTVGMNITFYIDSTVEAVNTYEYKIFAFSGQNVSGYSDTSQVIVPVELVSLQAFLVGHSVNILWATATEINNLGFEIERKIINVGDGEWERIGFVEGRGTTTEIQNYQFIDNINDIQAKSLSYKLKQIDYDGSYEYSDEVEVTNPAPMDFALHQNYPNPFNNSTVIIYSIPQEGLVELKVYNLLGEEVASLLNDTKQTGHYEVSFDATGLPSGIYFFRLRAGDFLETKKMILLK